MSKQIISYCGDLCNECPRYTATKSNSRKELEYLAELWYRLGFRDSIMDPEDMKCSGCSKEKECTEGINKCKHLENINNCGECQHFPCDNINRVFEKAEYFVKTHTELRKKMLSIATPSQETKEVHTKYILGYTAENKAYLAVQSFLVSADSEKLYDSIKLFSEADTIFLEATDMMDKLLSEFGLKWSDIR